MVRRTTALLRYRLCRLSSGGVLYFLLVSAFSALRPAGRLTFQLGVFAASAAPSARSLQAKPPSFDDIRPRAMALHLPFERGRD
jgi:hypothetical protein